MKAFLMYRDHDLDLDGDLPPSAADLTKDLGLEALLATMAAGDKFLLSVATPVTLASLVDPEAIRYRQHVLADCLAHPSVVREIYAVAVEAIEGERRAWSGWGRFPDTLLGRSVEVMQTFVRLLKRLRDVADAHADDFSSEGFTRLFGMLATELDDAYLRSVEDHLRRLKFQDGILISAELGDGNKGTDYVLRRSRAAKRSWRERLSLWDRSGYVYQIPDRDESGFAALTDLKGRGISLAATALAQSVDHVLSFFSLLRSEIGFYIGCLNLHDQLARKGEPTCFPDPLPSGNAVLSARGLYDVGLSLHSDQRTIGNELDADGKSLVMITGANRGGKSTFLRSIGLAQLLMQCGMFVGAESFRADVRIGIFAHFKREEDATMKSGKLDEELRRMSTIVDQMNSASLILLNESFASTNEREGSEIARQIVRALTGTGIKVIYVTHLFDLAQGFYVQKLDTALFLRAERQADGQRTFRLHDGEPMPTSYGEDVYRRIFDAVPGAASGGSPGEPGGGREALSTDLVR